MANVFIYGSLIFLIALGIYVGKDVFIEYRKLYREYKKL